MNGGELYLADLAGAQGREQQGVRPVLIVGSDAYHFPGLVFVVPLTTRDRGLVHHVRVAAGPASGLRQDSFAMTEQTRALGTVRLRTRPLGRVPMVVLDEVRSWLADELDIATR